MSFWKQTLTPEYVLTFDYILETEMNPPNFRLKTKVQTKGDKLIKLFLHNFIMYRLKFENVIIFGY